MRRLRWLAGAVTVLGLLASMPASAHPGGQRDRFPARIELPDGFQPEGITTGRGTTVYVGSLANGAIWRGSVRTGGGTVLVAGRSGRVAVGVDYDHRRGLLWVAGGDTGTVRVYEGSTGAELATYSFDAGFLNDVVVTEDAVYVTDSLKPQLAVVPLSPWRLVPHPRQATTIPLSGDLVYTDGFNANGIAAAGGHLLIVQSNTGRLFRVDPDSGESTRIQLGGALLTNGDGLELRGSTLYAVRNRDNVIAVVRLAPKQASGRVVDHLGEAGFDVPTTVTLAAQRLWAVNARFGTTPTPDTEYWITQVSRHGQDR
jgi:sugar lactone lactonase YvrE